MDNWIAADIHSHMLYEVDDGSENFEMTKAMIRMSCEEGCKYLFVTPHSGALNRKSNVINKLESIKKWIKVEELEIEIYLGTEVYIDDEEDSEKMQSIIKKLKKGTYYTLNETNYVLIEFYFGGFVFEEVVKMVAQLFEHGYIPVIAHAEKYGVSFEDLQKLKSMGCMLQINLYDVYSEYSHEMVEMANKLLKAGLVDFVGTDAHKIDRRKPEIKKYVEYLYKEYPKDYIDKILIGNAVKCLNL